MSRSTDRSEKLSQFVNAVRASGLVPETDVNALAQASQAPNVDPEALARDLVQRKLLTAYQAKKLWKGQGSDLHLNQYVLLDKIGEGGMGEVFRARHQRLDRDVALKVMRRERMKDPEAVKRFRREILAAASLAHENVVLAYDADQSGDVHFFAMEYVEGTNLDRHVRGRGPLPVGEACDYICQVARGLQHAHERGLIHRDIKPSNLLLSHTGDVKISDLGLVRLDDPEKTLTRITKDGVTVGTPDFVSPEQARNPQSADIRSDIYSLGCTFYFLLTGQVPYPMGTPTEKMLCHTRQPFPVPYRNDLSIEIHRALEKMTAKRPEERFQQPLEIIDVLGPFVPKKAPPTMAEMPPAMVGDEPITEDYMPAVDVPEKTDSRFALPSSANLSPTPKGRGCLGIVVILATLVTIAAQALAR